MKITRITIVIIILIIYHHHQLSLIKVNLVLMHDTAGANLRSPHPMVIIHCLHHRPLHNSLFPGHSNDGLLGAFDANEHVQSSPPAGHGGA